MRRLHVPNGSPKARRYDLDDPQVWQRVLSDYAEGMSVKALADRYEAVRSSVDTRLRRSGITPRGQSEAELTKWRRMSPRQRAHQVKAAHQATLGMPKSMAAKEAHARATEARLHHVSPLEITLIDAIRQRGYRPHQQTAIGPYNCDFSLNGVAVEVFGGQWHFYGRHAARMPERTRYILDRGWPMIFTVIDNNFPIGPRLADEVIAATHEMRRDPTAPAQYRVIRGDGQLLSAGCANDAQFAIVGTLRQAKRLRATHEHITG
ncbi:MAG: hypothetical protein RLZZ200_2698 [Pseudomonadota bacterium]|jgi:very-short-patch-repair endonuclease